MKIEFLSSVDQRIFSFLNRNAHLFFHTSAYAEFISSAFSCRYLFAAAIDGDEDSDEVKTILPFVEVKSLLFGNRILSTAYLEYGGFAGEKEGVAPIVDALREKYGSTFDDLEIRGGMEEFDAPLSAVMVKKNIYKRFVLKLGSEEEVWNNIQKSKRKAIKKAGDLVEVKDISVSEIDMLYDLYVKNMRHFGSPCYGIDYFRQFYLKLVNKKLGKILGAYDKSTGKLIAALFGLCYRDRVHIIIAISDPTFQELRSNDAVHWECIRWACVNNFVWFDFGRVREESGQFEYKQKWGPLLMDLPSYFQMWNGKEVPIVDPHQAKYRFFVAVWKMLPLWLTKKIGHRLRKELGI
ncbi:GNAT family N-acetyltransferase [Candidatus Woesearchaeota archaeon]|nr:GNAT family N-acetyltransferase [Candidatus Woesearchaeota archaeon]